MEQVLDKIFTLLDKEEGELKDYAVDVAESSDHESYISNQKDYFIQKGRVEAIRHVIGLIDIVSHNEN